MNFELFLGRFHPLLVHLPIGFLLLAIIFEIVGIAKKNSAFWRIPVLYTLISGIVASLVTVITGLWLSKGSTYDANLLDTHKWLGICVLIVSILIFTIKLKVKKDNPVLAGSFMMVLLLNISLAGHFGGNLTHGKGYLFEYGPDMLKTIVGLELKTKETLDIENPDSVFIYKDILQPAFKAKCVQCHGEGKQSGKLSLEYYHQLHTSADSGNPIVPGNFAESELFRRVSISPASDKYMPPKGEPLSYTELNILKYWIQEGADSLQRFEYDNMNEELIELLIRDFGLDYHPKPFYERVKADTIPRSLFRKLNNAGFRVDYLSENNNLLDVKYIGSKIRESDIGLLQEATKNITFLDLSNCQLTDDLLNQLPELDYLSVLNLNKNMISDDAHSKLSLYPNLEVLNLYGTDITNNGLEKMLQLPSLKRVYVWDTQVTDEFVAKLDQTEIKVVAGF